MLHGKVWATSEIDQGSIFYLELPFVETFAIKTPIQEENLIPELLIQEEITRSTTQNFRPNILIVEDNPDLRTYLSMILEEDYNVEVVENGQEAWDRLRVSSSPQLIISDIMMPVMDGIQLLEKVKNAKGFQDIPMIMLTARQSLEVKISALRIGVDDYLTKPFKEEELKARVANLIKNSQNRSISENVSTDGKSKIISARDLVWLKEMENILEENINNSNFKISDVANQMALSPRRLQQKIKEITGLTPKQYQRSIRLNKARTILKSGQVRTVSEAMYQIGLDNRTYFSKIYLEEFGVNQVRS